MNSHEASCLTKSGVICFSLESSNSSSILSMGKMRYFQSGLTCFFLAFLIFMLHELKYQHFKALTWFELGYRGIYISESWEFDWYGQIMCELVDISMMLIVAFVYCSFSAYIQDWNGVVICFKASSGISRNTAYFHFPKFVGNLRMAAKLSFVFFVHLCYRHLAAVNPMPFNIFATFAFEHFIQCVQWGCFWNGRKNGASDGTYQILYKPFLVPASDVSEIRLEAIMCSKDGVGVLRNGKFTRTAFNGYLCVVKDQIMSV